MNKLKDDIIKSEITELTLNEATYENVIIKPTLINFFFGKNGTGKTTISNNIKNNTGLTFKENKTINDYEILVYNKEFIDTNLTNYESLPGVYTLAKENIEIKEQIDIKNSEKEKLSNQLDTIQNNIQNNNDNSKKIQNEFIKNTWCKTITERSTFKEALKGNIGRKNDFIQKLINTNSSTDKTLDELTALYDTAFNDNSKRYNLFNSIADINILDNTDTEDILNHIIVNTADTYFSKFINYIGASNWVKQGFNLFNDKANDKCPYCQQKLPDNFVEELKKCYDEEYEKSISSIRSLQNTYNKNSEYILNHLSTIPSDILPELSLSQYRDKLSLLKELINNNKQVIDEKLKSPQNQMTLEKTVPLLEELSSIINDFNKKIEFNNDVVSKKKEKQTECSNHVWSYFFTKYKIDIDSLKKKIQELNIERKKLITKKEEIEQKIAKLKTTITSLSKSTLNTKEAVININKILKDCGFESFTIREKENTPNVYEIIRPNGSPAKNLSEGERNFIAFLYFYNLIKGKKNTDDDIKDKIVVIDDPVSSMDSNSLFIISSLIRELIDICANNAERQDGITQDRFIKQIFLLTHNAYFHNEISYNRVKNHNFVNIYIISKVENISSIKACIKEDPQTPSVIVNYNPVQNSYAALWSEYNEVSSPISLMSVIRKILEYYFLQMCGYDGSDLRKIILQDNKDKFISVDDEGNPDTSDYQLAQSMLAYIKIQDKGFNEGYFFNEPGTDDISTYKKTFKMIFELMEQNQHYQMMMNSVNNKGDE